MEKLFKLKEHNTTVKTEVMAGITTFLPWRIYSQLTLTC